MRRNLNGQSRSDSDRTKLQAVVLAVGTRPISKRRLATCDPNGTNVARNRESELIAVSLAEQQVRDLVERMRKSSGRLDLSAPHVDATGRQANRVRGLGLQPVEGALVLDWNMPVSGWQVVVPPLASAVVSVVSVLAAYFIGRGAEKRKQRDTIYESNHSLMIDLFSSINLLTSAMDRHVASREDPSNETFDRMWEITTGVTWIPGRRDGKILHGVLQPTDEGLIVDLWIRTRLTLLWQWLDQRDKDDEFEDQKLRSHIRKVHTRLQRWAIRDLPVSWFAEDLKHAGLRMLHPLYLERQSDLVPLNLDPETLAMMKEFRRQDAD